MKIQKFIKSALTVISMVIACGKIYARTAYNDWAEGKPPVSYYNPEEQSGGGDGSSQTEGDTGGSTNDSSGSNGNGSVSTGGSQSGNGNGSGNG